MYQKFLTARSPLRLLEKGLHGGLGAGNLGLVLAGHGVGKTSFLVGVALDGLLREERVLHIALDQTVAHTRDYYETVFTAFVANTGLADVAKQRAEIARRRAIRALPLEEFSAAKLEEIIAVESEAGSAPALVVVEGFDAPALARAELTHIRKFAAGQSAQFWFSLACAGERKLDLPAELASARSAFSVIVALEPGADEVVLRALKDHENPNVEALRVALDPQTLLLRRR